MKRHIALGTHVEGDVSASICNLQAFLMAPECSEIYVEFEDGSVTTVEKGEVVWHTVEPER